MKKGDILLVRDIPYADIWTAESLCDDKKVEFFQCDVRKLPYQKIFDMVTAIQVNHYFRKDERIAVIKNSYDALAENAML